MISFYGKYGSNPEYLEARRTWAVKNPDKDEDDFWLEVYGILKPDSIKLYPHWTAQIEKEQIENEGKSMLMEVFAEMAKEDLKQFNEDNERIKAILSSN